MRTIRQQLTRHLLLGWAVLLVTGGGLAYWTARAALTRQFDDALRGKAMALTSLTEQNKSGRVKLQLADQFMREFDADVSTAYFQIWHGDGTVVERSKSLGSASLPFRYGTLYAPEFWNLKLPPGLAGRAVGLKFQPPTAKKKQEPSLEAILVVAADRQALDQPLAVLRLVLAGCGTLILILTAAIVPLLVRRELRPLDRLSDQAQRITAQSLSTRFPTTGIPSELTPISTRLNDLLQRLQSAFERERQFSADLAHEFRTPITELRSLAEVALKWPDLRSSETDHNVLAIAAQMESIINRLLAIARSEQGRWPVSAEAVDLAGLVAAVCHPLQTRAAARRLDLQLDVAAALEIRSDPVLLRSIVTNLVDNAIAYAPPHGTVRVQSEAQNGRFTLRVINPVEHLTTEDVSHIFERFWRKDPARSTSEHSGLGLALARAFAASLGYTLSAALNVDASLAIILSGPSKLEAPSQPIFAQEQPPRPSVIGGSILRQET